MFSLARPIRSARPLAAHRVALILAVTLGVLLPVSRHSAVHAAALRLDLAAMVLTPADLPDPGYVFLGGRLITPSEQARRLAVAGTAPAVSPAATPAVEIRWLRGFESSLGLLPQGGTTYAPVVGSRIDEYAGATSARAGYAETLQQAAAAGATQVDLEVDIGNEAVALVPPSPAGGLAFGVEVTFRTADIVGTLTLGQAEDDPDLAATAVDLAQRLSDRIDAVRDGSLGLSSLGTKILRIDDIGPESYPLYIERYLLLDGVAVQRYDETAEDVAARTADYQASGIDAAYELQQFVPAGAGTWQDDTQFLAMLFHFTSEEAAATWVRRMPAIFAFYHGSAYADVRVLPDPPPLGDAASGYSYVATTGRDAQGFGFYFQSGRDVALIQIAGVPTVERAIVQALAASQLTCLQALSCSDSATGA